MPVPRKWLINARLLKHFIHFFNERCGTKRKRVAANAPASQFQCPREKQLLSCSPGLTNPGEERAKQSRLLTDHPHPFFGINIIYCVSDPNYPILGHLTKPKKIPFGISVYFFIKQDANDDDDDDDLLIRKVMYYSPYYRPENNSSKKEIKITQNVVIKSLSLPKLVHFLLDPLNYEYFTFCLF